MAAVFVAAFCFAVSQTHAAKSKKPALSGQTPSPSPAARKTEPAPKARAVVGDLLGVRIGDDQAAALIKLDSLGKRTTSPRKDGGQRHNVALQETSFTYVILIADAAGKVRRMSGFVRPGQEIPFEKLGDTASASKGTEGSVVWDMVKEGPGRNYRLVAKGREQKAQVIFLIGAPKRGTELLSDTIELPTPSPSPKKKSGSKRTP